MIGGSSAYMHTIIVQEQWYRTGNRYLQPHPAAGILVMGSIQLPEYAAVTRGKTQETMTTIAAIEATGLTQANMMAPMVMPIQMAP